MPWEETEEYIRSGHRSSDEFDPDSLRTIDVSAEEGIKAIVGCPKGQFEAGKCKVGVEVQSYLFIKEKGWTVEKAKSWFERQQAKEAKPIKEAFRWAAPVKLGDKDRVLQIVALNVGQSRNGRNWTRDELLRSARTLTGMPLRANHDPYFGDMGKSHVKFAEFEDNRIETLAWVDPEASLPYNGQARDPIELVKEGVITKASIGAPSPIVNSKEPHYVIFDEVSLIVPPEEPGDPETSVRIVEKLLATKNVQDEKVTENSLEDIKKAIDKVSSEIIDMKEQLESSQPTMDIPFSRKSLADVMAEVQARKEAEKQKEAEEQAIQESLAKSKPTGVGAVAPLSELEEDGPGLKFSEMRLSDVMKKRYA